MADSKKQEINKSELLQELQNSPETINEILTIFIQDVTNILNDFPSGLEISNLESEDENIKYSLSITKEDIQIIKLSNNGNMIYIFSFKTKKLNVNGKNVGTLIIPEFLNQFDHILELQNSDGYTTYANPDEGPKE